MIRRHARILQAHLQIFIADPLDKEREAKETMEGLKDCVEKMEGRGFGQRMSVKRQAKTLIALAEDPYNFMQHYSGWCPLW